VGFEGPLPSFASDSFRGTTVRSGRGESPCSPRRYEVFPYQSPSACAKEVHLAFPSGYDVRSVSPRVGREWNGAFSGSEGSRRWYDRFLVPPSLRWYARVLRTVGVEGPCLLGRGASELPVVEVLSPTCASRHELVPSRGRCGSVVLRSETTGMLRRTLGADAATQGNPTIPHETGRRKEPLRIRRPYRSRKPNARVGSAVERSL
jgi:hypothetical protein